ncbi:alpha/beta hydrolase [Xanthomonas sp. SI]|uniref:alpha/beta hydrolase n=1 Tax=Xanthomonas sp. SI TaxID=2724123 RepID=UPI00163B2140|nr:alpha/beta hydrolase [Xanthomonas sp. SI]QNH14636.1 alpha/beta hydrolase fold protein [Xanthomonas sp. SI]
MTSFARILLGVTLLLTALHAAALHAQDGRLRERLRERLAQSATAPRAPLPEGARVLRDVAYGADPAQRFDVYLPVNARNAPLIVMVHGGGWANGDKDNPGVAANKVAHWLPQGYALVSVNYRLLPQATPLQQAGDVALAVAKVQALAAGWGADGARMVLMGHSAGAHLVALLDLSPTLLAQAGAHAPLATVALDSAAMDVEQVMQARHLPLYDRAFGSQRSDWIAASPYHQMGSAAPPLLAVCSSRRADACAQARHLADKATARRIRVEVLPQDRSHAEINHDLGLPSAYTDAVDAFLRSLR